MSAVGNRSYAAPEIINGVHDTSQHMEDVRILTSSSGHFVTDVTRTLSEHVAYYGLLVDSYSVGNVIRYCMTGVAPNLDVSDTIALENHVIFKLCGCLCALLPGGHRSHRPKRRIQYRSIGSIPREVWCFALGGRSHRIPSHMLWRYVRR
jgi:serine/threonine protein kinase